MAPECATDFIPAHEHQVRMVLFHSELNASYGLRPRVGLTLRLPYDRKDQDVRYTTLTGEPFAPPYGDIHHRSEIKQGVSDGDLLLRWQPSLSGASRWQLGLGTTVPIGATVPDPIALGRQGERHDHIQFGSGVFAPRVEVGWSRPFERLVATASLRGSFPFYENSRGFRAPVNVQWTAGPVVRWSGVSTAVNLTGQYQSVGRWNGEKDEGTGFLNTGVRLQLTIPTRLGFSLTPSIYREIDSRGSHDEHFSQGTTIGLSLARVF